MKLSNVVRSSFIAGLALVAPLIITIIALQFLLNWVTAIIDPVVQGTQLAQYTANIEVVAQALAAILIVLLITVLGYLAQRSFGERLFGWLDRGVSLVPLVRIIYTSVRQVSNALMERSNRYESTVLIEYPRDGLYVIGFITGDSPSQVQTIEGQEVYNVFLPNSPNPTGGKLVMAPADQVYEVDISVRRGIRLLMTTGIAEREDDVDKLREELEEAATTA